MFKLSAAAVLLLLATTGCQQDPQPKPQTKDTRPPFNEINQDVLDNPAKYAGQEFTWQLRYKSVDTWGNHATAPGENDWRTVRKFDMILPDAASEIGPVYFEAVANGKTFECPVFFREEIDIPIVAPGNDVLVTFTVWPENPRTGEPRKEFSATRVKK